ncbi:tail fiber domain-containing protein [Rubellicoccus peritrichatus]|uniref:Tail fiber domain-containing protein n=1 Tax=Rubellicoccus peritrichatus TaxID=3080537 RepID=A0AAQ3L7W3_9BACT|nr:tail fiber domain-containing protein [Puniceicoccus sp. CR14]WOO40302.1 tail fiber domain-containing protein [Puniceicoccus sp. CR14]
MKKYSLLPLTIVKIIALPFSLSATTYDELIDGELSGNPQAPSPIVLQAGINTVGGTIGNNGNAGATNGSDADFFTFTIPEGATATLAVGAYGNLGANPPGKSFMGYALTSAFTQADASAIQQSDLEAAYGFDVAGFSLSFADGAPTTTPFLTPDTYTFWLQETVDTIVEYSIQVVVAFDYMTTHPYQGRVSENGVLPTGTRYFKFALTSDSTSTSTFWANQPLAPFTIEPITGVPLSVNQGLFSVNLGDALLPNMHRIPTTVWQSEQLFLRVWYSEDSTDGSDGTFSILETIQITPTAFAHRALTADALSSSATIDATRITSGILQPDRISEIDASKITGTLDVARIPALGLDNLDFGNFGFAVGGALVSGANPDPDAVANGGDGTGTRMFWHPGKAAFRAGATDVNGSTNWEESNIGEYSVAMGLNTQASGKQSFAMGFTSTASGDQSVAMGNQATASGSYSIAMGLNNTADGIGAISLGLNSSATADYTIALGRQATASTRYAMAMGFLTFANEPYSLAVGVNNDANAVSGELFMVGNGIDNFGEPDNASNAFVVFQNGNATVQNQLTAASFVGDGSALTNLKVSTLTDPNTNQPVIDQTTSAINAEGEITQTAVPAVTDMVTVGNNFYSFNGQLLSYIDGSDLASPALNDELDLAPFATFGDFVAVTGTASNAYVIYERNASDYELARVDVNAPPLSFDSLVNLTGFTDGALATDSSTVWLYNTVGKITAYNASNLSGPLGEVSYGPLANTVLSHFQYHNGVLYGWNDAAKTIEVFDVSTPGNPTRLTPVTLGVAAGQFALSGDRLYVPYLNTQNGHTMAIYNVGVPAAITSQEDVSLGTNSLNGLQYSAAINGNTLGLFTALAARFYDISTPGNTPALLSSGPIAAMSSNSPELLQVEAIGTGFVARDALSSTSEVLRFYSLSNGYQLTGDSWSAETLTVSGQLNVAGLTVADGSGIQGLDASNITSGTLDASRIGTLSVSQIPNLDASKITTGTLAVSVPSTNLTGTTLSLGTSVNASGSHARAFGQNTQATGAFATAWGSAVSDFLSWPVDVTGNGLVDFDDYILRGATADYSTTWGLNTVANAARATAFGNATRASGSNATAIGDGTVASGPASLATGFQTTASGNDSFATGLHTIASLNSSAAVGQYNDNTVTHNLFMVGNGTSTSRSNAFAVGLSGDATLQGTLTANQGVITNRIVTATTNQITGNSSIAVGGFNTISGSNSFAVGDGNTASNGNTVAVGRFTAASAPQSFAAGQNTVAEHANSAAFGLGTRTYLDNQFVIGKYNAGGFDHVFTIGIGTSSSPDSGFVVTDGGQVFAYGYNPLSDRKLKENISSIDPVLDNILQIEPRSFTWKHDPDGGTQIGVIAQEVLPLFPDIVNEGRERLSVNYDAFGVLAIKAIQEQQAIINEQEATINRQRAQIAALKLRADLQEKVLTTQQAEINLQGERLAALEKLITSPDEELAVINN